MSAEITVGRAGQLLQLGKFQPDARRQRVQRRHDAKPQRLMDDVVEFRHPLAPAHPEPAENQSEPVDEGHPQRKFVADEEVTDQRQRGDDRADRNESHSDP